jgi:cell wall-associated NlpC family hydrolase
MTVVTVCSSTVVLVARPIGADTVASAKAKAAQIESELTAAQAQVSALSQQYDAARDKLSQVDTNIATTKAAIAVNQHQVAKDKSKLEKAAIANYVTDGSASSDNPVFSNNEKTLGAATEYNQIASGDINQAVANLHTAENKLSAQEAQLTTQQGQAQSAVASEQAAVTQNAQEVQAETSALSQENGEIATLVQQQAAAQAAQAAQATAAKLAAAQSAAVPTTSSQSSSSSSSGEAPAASIDPPPVAAGGAGAVAAAESQLGVPYVWGGETPGVGFDCSGLTAWAWGQAGVSLPHYSGAQFEDSTPVPVSDLQPGDLLFYGPGGDDHVAMYVSPGTMIEAPETGETVHLTALRLETDPGDDYGEPFVGAGRP